MATISRQLRLALTRLNYSASGRCLMGVGDQQSSTTVMVANTHNPAPATAHDTPIYPRVTISATQANIYKALIGISGETPHRCER
jgi:hypothetical protein